MIPVEEAELYIGFLQVNEDDCGRMNGLFFVQPYSCFRSLPAEAEQCTGKRCNVHMCRHGEGLNLSLRKDVP